MKKVILGVGMLLSGMMGGGFIFLCTVLNDGGIGASSVLGCIGFMGLTVPFLFCLFLIIAGLIIACTDALSHKQ